MKDLLQQMAKPGKVEWVSFRPERKGQVNAVEQIEVNPEVGIVGDHYRGRSGDRHITLISAEHLQAVASFLGKGSIDPALTRRNLVISGINLSALKEKEFTVGEVTLQTTGPCAPCSQMETNLGHGGYNAMRGHGGICAKVISAGMIRIGDQVKMKT